jgi:hypothetical protein
MMLEMIVTTMNEMPMMNRIENQANLSGGYHDMPLETADHSRLFVIPEQNPSPST